jgi:hypothetical protein
VKCPHCRTTRRLAYWSDDPRSERHSGPSGPRAPSLGKRDRCLAWRGSKAKFPQS